MSQTTFAKLEEVNRTWYQVSAKGQVIGQLATRIAVALMGKTKVNWTPSTDAGDYVVVTDVEAINISPKKAEKKVYRFHSGFIGGIKEVNLATLHQDKPEEVLFLAVKRMLPKTIQARHQLKRLKIVKGAAHPHVGQSPKALP
jgi:large subunit ribosomal protein L13